MNKNAKCYYQSAIQLNLPVDQEPLINGFTLLLGKRQYFFYGARTPINLGGCLRYGFKKNNTQPDL